MRVADTVKDHPWRYPIEILRFKAQDFYSGYEFLTASGEHDKAKECYDLHCTLGCAASFLEEHLPSGVLCTNTSSSAGRVDLSKLRHDLKSLLSSLPPESSAADQSKPESAGHETDEKPSSQDSNSTGQSGCHL